MKHITFWLDFISPYAYLAFEQLPRALQGLSYSVDYRPVLFAGMLKQHGQLGPAEIEPKREWTYRQVLWQAHQHGIEMQMPASHPFNPLPLLRLAVASGAQGLPNRHVCETIFRHVWRGGAEATDADRLAALAAALEPRLDPASDEVKLRVKASGEEAAQAKLFGVPSFVVDGQVFWGFDSLPMLRAWCEGDPWFATAQWRDVGALPVGLRRQPAGSGPA